MPATNKLPYYHDLQVGKLYKTKSVLRATRGVQKEAGSIYPAFDIYVEAGSVLIPIGAPYQPERYRSLRMQYDFVDFIWMHGQYHLPTSDVTDHHDLDSHTVVNLAFDRDFALTVRMANYFELIET